jgi:hypothetical protein
MTYDYQYGYCHYFADIIIDEIRNLVPKDFSINYYLILAERLDDDGEVIDDVLIHAYIKVGDYYLDSEGFHTIDDIDKREQQWLDTEETMTPENYSFNSGSGGTFTDCSGGDYSFAGGVGPGGTLTSTSVFTNCTGGNLSFGGGDSAGNGGGITNGTFTNCIGGDESFGGNGGSAGGNFTSCTGGYASFGGTGSASGNFRNCTGGTISFGGDGGNASGEFKNCAGGNYSFGGYNGTANGTFTDCTGGIGSFNL